MRKTVIADGNGSMLDVIYSSRLVLKKFGPDDMDFILHCSNCPQAAGRFMSQEKLTPEKFQERMASHFYWNDRARAYTIGIRQGELIGLIRFWEKPADSRTALVSLQICLPERRRQGYGTEAQIILVKRLFDCCRYGQVEMHTEQGNVAQQRCLEKMGFTFLDSQVYSDLGQERSGKLYRLTRAEYDRLHGYIY
ncbi:MAG: GNAT family N-acetyltransferase [Thermodesulfobacteriota bacterium]